jgi:mRNA interferase MazF
MNVQRGDVVLVDYPYSVGGGSKVRPALVIQNDRDNHRLATTIIAQITGTTRRASLETTQVSIDTNTPDGSQSGLLRNSVVNCVNLFTMDQRDILRKLGQLPPGLMQQVEAAVKAPLQLP